MAYCHDVRWWGQELYSPSLCLCCVPRRECYGIELTRPGTFALGEVVLPVFFFGCVLLWYGFSSHGRQDSAPLLSIADVPRGSKRNLLVYILRIFALHGS